MKTKIYYISLILQFAIILIFAGGINFKSTAAESFIYKFEKDVSGRNLGGFANKQILIDARETAAVTIKDLARKARAASAKAGANENGNGNDGQYDYDSLRKALVNNKIDEAKLIIKKCPDIQKTGSETNKPLLHQYLQVRNADKEVIELLLENGAYINEIWRGSYPLLLALTRGRFDIAEILIKRGADISIKDAADNSLIHLVMRECEDTRAVDFFYENKFDFNVKNKYGETPLFLMIINNKISAIKYFIEKGADIKAAVNNNSTPLEAAISHGYEKTAIYLVEKGADIKFKNESGLTPLHKAAQYGLTDLMAVLISNKADCDSTTKYGSTPLFFAVERGALPAVELLLNAGANPNVRDSSNTTPLMNAVFSDRFEIADYFITKYPSTLSALNINEKNKLLLVSAEKGNARIIEKLIKNGTDINAAETSGNTALHLAVIRANLEVAKALLKSGADVNRRNNMGRTALHFAAEAGKQEMIEILKQHGADFFTSDKAGLTSDAIINKKIGERVAKFEEITSCTGETFLTDYQSKLKPWHSLCFKTYPKLHQAAILKSPDILQWLIKNGADCNAKDENNKTAIEIAMDNYDLESFDILFSKSAEINVNSKFLSRFIMFLIKKGHRDYFFNKIVPAYPAVINTIIQYTDIKNYWHEFSLVNYSVVAKDIELLKKLIALGADCNDVSSSRATPMYFAVNEIIKIFNNPNGNSRSNLKRNFNLVEEAAAENAKNIISDIFWEREDIKEVMDMVNLLTEKGAKINCASKDEIFDLITKAFDFENRKLIELIFNNLADVNLEFNGLFFLPGKKANKFAYTPLTLAIIENLPSTVKIMIQNKADLKFIKGPDKSKNSNSYGNDKFLNPLELSIAELNFNIADILIAGGAKLSDDLNENPFHFIVEKICCSSVKKILKGGVIETEKLNNILKYFIDKGFDIKAKNKDGQTPLEMISDWDIASAAINDSKLVKNDFPREELHLKYIQIYNSLNEIKSAAIKAFKKYQ